MKSAAIFWGALFAMCCAEGLAQPIDFHESCSRIVEPRARLACYDSAGSAMPSPSGTAPSPASLFGLRHAKTSLQRIIAGVQWYSFNEKGKFTVGLDNGQVWRQFNDDTGKAKFTAASNRVVIKHGFFDSYDLKINRMNAVFRVERIK